MTEGQQNRPDDEPEETTDRSEQDSAGVGDSSESPPVQSGSATNGGVHHGPSSNPEERNWAMLVHLAGFTGLLFNFVGNILAPLVVWLIFRGKSDMVDLHGKRALNFQISMSLYGFVLLLLGIVPWIVGLSILGGRGEKEADPGLALLLFTCGGSILLFILGFVFLLFWITMTIVAAVRASRGDPPGYVLTIPFLR